jgi:hypothetical protein
MNSEGFLFLVSTILHGPGGGGVDSAGTANPEVMNEAIRIARANGLYLLFGRRLLESGRELTRGQEALWEAEQERHSEFLRTIRFLNQASENGGFDFVVIKDCPTVEHAPRDVDVFISGADRDNFLRILLGRGLTLEYASAAETSLRGPGMLRIDVYSEVRYLGREFVREQFLWDSRRSVSAHGVQHPGLSPEATYLLNLIHGFLGRGSITLLDLLDFARLEAGITDPGVMREEAGRCGWAHLYDRLVTDLAELRRRVLEDGRAASFPRRYPRGFVMDSVGEVVALTLEPRRRFALMVSLMLDQVVFHLENTGIANGLRRTRLAPRLGNSLGHGLRLIRGDSKGWTWSRRVEP